MECGCEAQQQAALHLRLGCDLYWIGHMLMGVKWVKTTGEGVGGEGGEER